MIWFWSIFVSLVIVWYIVITVLVGIRGAGDIKKLVRDSKNSHDKN